MIAVIRVPGANNRKPSILPAVFDLSHFGLEIAVRDSCQEIPLE
jgi:hypothetical protein